MKPSCFNFKALLPLLMLFSALSTFSQTKQYVDPVSVANLLVDDVSEERMAQTCRFHNLTESQSEDGFIVFSDKDDNTIRFKKTDNSEEGVNGKLIEVRTKDTLKTIDSLMKASGYQKHGTTYERGSRHTNTLTRCTLSTQGKTRILNYQKANK